MGDLIEISDTLDVIDVARKRIMLGAGLPMEKHKIVKFVVSWLDAALFNVTHTTSIRWGDNEVVIAVTIPYEALDKLEEVAETALKGNESDSDISQAVEPSR